MFRAAFLFGFFASYSLNGESVMATEGSWALTQTISSDYIFRGVRLAGASFQPGVEYTRGAGSMGLWSNVALNHTSAPTNPEIDWYGAYRLRAATDGMEVVPGFTLYSYPRARRSDGIYSVTFEPSLGANFDVHGVRLTPKIYYDLVLRGATYELNAAVAFALKSLGTELDLNAAIGTFRLDSVSPDSDPDEKNWGDYFAINASVPYRVTANGTLSLTIGYSAGRNNYFKQAGLPRRLNPDARSRAIVSLAYSLSL